MASAEKKQAVKKYEPTYTIPELVAAAKTEFKTTTVVVSAALTKAGKNAYTLEEAKQIINTMKNKEVKA
ncbi:MAG: hypothetical protein IKW37_01510 [Bacteroidaceae bacterium]|nr:hypothetical protein [Bacteroidaceae bacterium]